MHDLIFFIFLKIAPGRIYSYVVIIEKGENQDNAFVRIKLMQNYIFNFLPINAKTNKFWTRP